MAMKLATRLRLHWSPLEVKEEADSLTKNVLDGFDRARRITVDWSQMQWCNLDEAMMRV